MSKLKKDLIQKLKNGDVYVYCNSVADDSKLTSLMNEAFNDKAYSAYLPQFQSYGKFGRIWAGHHGRMNNALDIKDFYEPFNIKDRILLVLTAPFLLIWLVVMSQVAFWSLVLFCIMRLFEPVIVFIPYGIVWIFTGNYSEKLLSRWLMDKWGDVMEGGRY